MWRPKALVGDRHPVLVHGKTLKVSTLIPTPRDISTLRPPPPRKGPLRRGSTSTPHLPEGVPGGCLLFGTWVFGGQSSDLLWRSHLGACPNECIECSAADLLSNISTPIRPSVHPTIGCATLPLGELHPPSWTRRGVLPHRRSAASRASPSRCATIAQPPRPYAATGAGVAGSFNGFAPAAPFPSPPPCLPLLVPPLASLVVPVGGFRRRRSACRRR